MKKILFISFIIASFLFSACASYTMAPVSKMREIKLGMTKEQVINILGSDYKPASASEKDGALYESIAYYPQENRTEEYVYHFKNGILTEWKKEIVTQEKYITTESKTSSSSSDTK